MTPPVPPTAPVLVTGCSSGIGRATVQALLRGPRPGLGDRATGRDPRRPRGCRRAGASPGRHRRGLDGRGGARGGRAEHGAVGGLVNNAGYGEYGPVEEVPARRRAPAVRDQRVRAAPAQPAGAAGHAGRRPRADRQRVVDGRPDDAARRRGLPREQVRRGGPQRRAAVRDPRLRRRRVGRRSRTGAHRVRRGGHGGAGGHWAVRRVHARCRRSGTPRRTTGRTRAAPWPPRTWPRSSSPPWSPAARRRAYPVGLVAGQVVGARRLLPTAVWDAAAPPPVPHTVSPRPRRFRAPVAARVLAVTERRPSLLGRTPRDESGPAAAGQPVERPAAHGRRGHRRHQGRRGRGHPRGRGAGPGPARDPAPQQEPGRGRGHHRRRRARARSASTSSHAVGHRCGRVHRRRPGRTCCSRRTCRGATSRCATRSARRLRLPVVVENDANAARLGRVAVRGGPRRDARGLRQPRHRHRRGDDRQRHAAARPVRRRGGVRAHAGGARTAAAASAATAAAGSSTPRATCWSARRASWPPPARRWPTGSSSAPAATSPAITGPLITGCRAGRRPGRARAVRGGRAVARRRHREPRGGGRPGHVRHRRRSVRGR